MGSIFLFTTGNARVKQPSLDVVMWENYVDSLNANGHMGGIQSPGMDGTFRGWPLTWEPMVNSPGTWLVAKRTDLITEEKARILYSLAWLSVVLANVRNQLFFRLFPVQSYTANKLLEQIGRYALVANGVRDFLEVQPSGVREPWLSSSDEHGRCTQCAAIWRKPGEGFCALVVVVNKKFETSSTTFTLEGAEHFPGASSATLQRVDGFGQAAFRQGRLEITQDAYDTHVYLTHCADEPAYVSLV
eukprot:TRINITY_DN32666_c0_g2_i1.p1 TRINITY_DN32666_c0_g2~~TRINITY_DN32666_c0_g2_i1.p1  ORF type:complete len:245 (+),score=22.71 TRINITY_DN32666_c0_g2_i1:545-1279(+)